jgi:hypothetical protein
VQSYGQLVTFDSATEEHTVTIALNGADLAPLIVQDLLAPGVTPGAAVGRALEAYVFERFQSALARQLIKPPVLRFFGSSVARCVTLAELASSGYETWYTEVHFATRPGDCIEALIVTADGIQLRPIEYGGGVRREVQMKIRAKKTQTNHEFRINHLVVPAATLQPVLARFETKNDLAQPLMANFAPGPNIEGFRTVSFDDMLTGERVFCECARAAHAKWVANARAETPQFVPNSWPHRLIALLERASYAKRVCHLCLAQEISPEESVRRYGPGIESGFAAYVDQVKFDMKVDARSAREDIKQRLGLSRWLREAALYRMTCDLFAGWRVLREASPEWLGRLRLDIYLPELKLAIEHQGEQHFRPVTVFGGAAAHARAVERDELKRRLCHEHGVTVIEVRYDATLTKASLRNRLRGFINLAGRED